jgi:hypothetical protein
MKEQRVEELYEHFDVEFYEKARTMVLLHSPWASQQLMKCSILNGPATGIEEAYLSMFM